MSKKHKKSDKELSVEEQYKKLTPYEHIIHRPDTYVGSLVVQRDQMWVYNAEKEKLEFREIKYVPGLYKIFDEILVNAADNYQRDNEMKFIKVTIEEKEGVITIVNGGKGIPIKIHKDHNMYVPQLIFGNLLTSSNYNDDIKKTTGGRNGYGAKLTNIFSEFFIVETASKEQKKKYYQKFYDNMLKFDEPVIENYKGDDYTSIKFKPDLKKFKMDKLDEDIIALFKKRVYDMAGVTPKGVSVYLNNTKIKIKNFEDYIKMYLNSADEEEEQEEVDNIIYFEQPHERWEIGFALSESQFQQVSFVNSISTSHGGTHVNYATDKLVKCIMEKLEKKAKDLTIKSNHVKQHMFMFVNCLIDNPAFDSQTKEQLTTKKEEFGSSFDYTEDFIKKVLKSNIVERCLRYAKTREDEKNLRKLNKGGGKKSGKIIGIPKLNDANWAGGKNSEKCTLILTEGDSAKALAMGGIEVVGRDSFGCFPLRGKMLNVRGCTTNKMLKNEEVQNLIKILGLKIGQTYTDLKPLRYGSILIMADQDVDGSHIKGLIINFIDTFWPSLIKIDGFMRQFITPILKISKGKEVYPFFTIPEYKKFVQEKLKGNLRGWKVKYYKGLGTSTKKEGQEYFSNIQRHRIDFEYNDKKDEDCIDLAFNKKKAEDRKKWLSDFDPETPPLDLDVDKISYETFVNRELILFSLYDNERCIPSLCDGLKPSERKILFACFKRNLKEEIKVSQLVGYIGEHSAYHHGEQSLASTIVGMAQDFVGSNNINLLMPNGQFGTRAKGGKDCAASRYIFTTLNKITRHIFNPDDLPIMSYKQEEGQSIEPKYYMPIIPMILVNGCNGIGTGWSTEIPCYNPKEIVASLKNKINGKDFIELNPWYKGWTGSIQLDPNKKESYVISGKFQWRPDIDERTIEITELPIRKWTEDYKNYLFELAGLVVKDDSDKKDKKNNKKEDETKSKKKKPVVVDNIKENHAGGLVNFEIQLKENFAAESKKNDALITKIFGLQSSISMKNMVLFSSDGKIKKYETVNKIMEEFYTLRMEYYFIRKKYLIANMKRELAILSNKARFIKMVADEELEIRRKKKKDLVNELYDLKFDPYSKLEKMKFVLKDQEKIKDELVNQNIDEQEEEEKKEKDESKNQGMKVASKEYDYLLGMNLWSVTLERVEEILKQKEDKEVELKELEKTTEKMLWIKDLDSFLNVYEKWEKDIEEEQREAIKAAKEGGKKAGVHNKKRKRGPNKKGKKSDNESIDSFVKSKETNDTSSNKNGSSLNESKISSNSSKMTQESKNQKGKRGRRKKGENTSSVSEASSESESDSNMSESSSGDEAFRLPLAERLKRRTDVKVGDKNFAHGDVSVGGIKKKSIIDDDDLDVFSILDNKELP